MVRIERLFIRDLVANLLAELGEGSTPCIVIVEIAAYDGMVREWSQGFT